MERPFVTGKNYIIRDRVPWFRRRESPHQTPLAMIGVRSGNAVVILGGRDAPLAAAVAVVTGLNGRTLVVDPDPAVGPRLTTAAAQAGALVDFQHAPVTSVPLEAGTFDVAVVDVRLAAQGDTDQRATMAQAFRAVRPLGRIIVIEGAAPAGLFGRRDPTPALSAGAVQDLLEQAGGRAVRKLAEVDGVSYFETRRP